MLILSRHKEEEIIVGEGADAIVITIVEIRGDKVRLGITAPQQVKVNRREVYDAMTRERRVDPLPARQTRRLPHAT